ncbi:hypothetical protein D3C83_14000 [compost metagenome]
MRFLRGLRFEFPDLSGRARQQLHARRALDEHRQHRRLLDCPAGAQLPVMREQNGAVVAQRVMNELAFLVPDRRAGPF